MARQSLQYAQSRLFRAAVLRPAVASVLCVGHAVQDFIYRVVQLPTRAGKHPAQGLSIVGGGPAATAAVAVARLGGHALLAARIGDDPVGELITAELSAHGVDCSHLRRCAGAASSSSAVMVDADGERMIINHLDPALPVDPAWLPDPTALGVDAVLADSRWPEGAAAAMRAARAAGLPAVLDADRPMAPGHPALGLATHVAFSADGLADVSGHRDPVRGLDEFAARHGGWCCVTVGALGTYVHEGVAVRLLPGFAVPVVDTLGAGDVWHGAFVLALAEGLGEEQAVRFANAAAALKVQTHGGRSGAPRRSEVERLLAQGIEGDRGQ